MIKKVKGYLRIIGVTSVLFGVGSQAYGQTMSFEQAYTQTMSQNSLLKASVKQEEVHQYKLKATKGLRYPTVEAFGAGLYLYQSFGFDWNHIRDGLADIIKLPNPGDLGDWQIPLIKRGQTMAGFKASAPIFTGGKINAAVKAGELEVKIGEKDTEDVNNKLISDLAERYYLVKLSEENLVVRAEVLNGMQEHLNNALKLEEHGMIAPVERMSADVAVANAQREVLAAEKDAKLARIALANTLEVDDVSDELISDFFIATGLASESFYQEAALANYPQLQKLDLQVELAEQALRAKKADYYPTVAAVGSTVLAHNNPIRGVLYDNDKPWFLGIGVNYTLSHGMKTRNEVRAAKATKESVLLFQDRAQMDIKMLIAKLYQDIQKQEDQISSLKVQESLATEFLRVRSKAFLEGFATSTDVVDAELNLSGVKLLKLHAHYTYTVSLAKLLEFTGASKDFIQFTK